MKIIKNLEDDNNEDETSCLLRRSTRKIPKSSRVPRSPFPIFVAHIFQKSGRGALLSHPSRLICKSSRTLPTGSPRLSIPTGSPPSAKRRQKSYKKATKRRQSADKKIGSSKKATKHGVHFGL
jgi:hypothetical protein